MIRTAALLGLLALSGAAAPATGWDEIAWPFGRDAWPPGRAFRCRGCDLQVFVRPKLGFCNCASGVADDAEVDAVSDIDLVSPDFAATQPGEQVHVAGLSGRARLYAIRMPDGSARDGAGYALSSTCDLITVAAIGRDAAQQGRVLVLLGSDQVVGWLDAKLGRRPTLVTAK